MEKQTNLYVYSRFMERITDYDLPIYMIGSSSRGNSTYFENFYTVIDLGFSYKHYLDLDINFFLKVDYVILTHEHSDHFNPKTLVQILDNHPNVKFIMSQSVAHAIQTNPKYREVITDEKIKFMVDKKRVLNGSVEQTLVTHDKHQFKYVPNLTSHGDITNVAVELIDDENHIMYASDLDNFEHNFNQHTKGLPKPDDQHLFTLLLLEANYDEDLVEQALAQNPNNFEALGNRRHISEQTTFPYVKRYLSDNGYFIPLHASKNYGTLIQDTK